MLKIGVIGYGYWGPNIVRNFGAIKGVRVVSVCDRDPEALTRARRDHPGLALYADYRDIARDTAVDAVAIVTPVGTHYTLAKDCLGNGKHIFIEKPFTDDSRQADSLIALAARKKLKIMVDHTFLFTGAVRRIKALIDANVLGRLYYYDSTRVSLGLFQRDVNVIWDLAPHDFSIIDYLIKEKPVAIWAAGASHFGRPREDIAYIIMRFKNDMIAHCNINWLSPVKVRSTLIGGEKKMLLWNDLEKDEKIKVYDKGVRIRGRAGIYKLLIEYRSGDMWSPRVDLTEALKIESQYFVDCIVKDKRPLNDGEAGRRVVVMLEAAQRSLKKGGAVVKL